MSTLFSDELSCFRSNLIVNCREGMVLDAASVDDMIACMGGWLNRARNLEGDVSRLTWNLEAQRTENRILEAYIRNMGGIVPNGEYAGQILAEIERPGTNVTLITRIGNERGEA